MEGMDGDDGVPDEERTIVLGELDAVEPSEEGRRVEEDEMSRSRNGCGHLLMASALYFCLTGGVKTGMSLIRSQSSCTRGRGPRGDER